MFQLIKIHKWAVIFAFLVGVIMVFPQIYFNYDNRDQYRGIYSSPTDNEVGYLTRIREVRDGHVWLGNPVSRDGKEDPYTQSPLGEIIIAYLGKMLFLDLNNSLLLARFLFTFLGFLAVYGIVFLLFKEKLTAISAAATFCLAKALLARGSLIALLKGGSPAPYLDYYRPVQPMVSWLFFFGFILFFWLFLEKKKWFFGVVSALILGFSFYVYPYTWSFLYAFLGVLCLILFFQKKWTDVKRIILTSLGGILVAIPYFLNYYRSALYSSFVDVTRRYGLIETRQPILGFLVPGLLILFLFFFPKKWRERFIFCLAILIAPFVVLNQQLITGKDFHSGHYHWFVNQPLAIIFLVMIVLYQTKFWQEKLKIFKNINLSKILACLIIGASFYAGIVTQVNFYKKSEKDILSYQRYSPIIEWFNTHAQKDEVFLAEANTRLADLLVIYTPLNSFYTSLSCIYLSGSNEKILADLFLFYRLDGLKGEDAQKFFFQKQERYALSKNVFGIYYRDMLGDAAALPDQIMYSFVQKYKDFLLIPLGEFLRINNVKYVVWDTQAFPQWRLDQYDFLNKVYETGNFKIYQMNSA